MNSDSTTVIDPFDTGALDEETELRALARAIQFSDRFALLFARCNQPQQRKRVIEKLQSQLPKLDVQEIHFTEPVTHLLDELRERIQETRPDVIFVSGLEYSLTVAADAYNTRFVVNLNAARNSFPQIIQSPLVLWVPEYALTAIAHGAPDFFSIRSGVYFFAAAPSETVDEASSLTSGGGWAAWNLSRAEKQERIAAIESLLSDYEALPSNQRDYYIEMQLHRRLGDLLYTQGADSFAQQHYEKLLSFSIELLALEEKLRALAGLGNVYAVQNQIEKAKITYQQSLEIAQELSFRKDEVQILTNLGSTYFKQGQMEKAEEAYKKSLEIAEKSGDRIGEANTLTWLGLLHIDQDRFDESEETLQKSLMIARETKNLFVESTSLNWLGNIFLQQGRLEEASDMYQQSLIISQRIGLHHNEGGTLYNLALLRSYEGKRAEALELAQQSVMVFEKTERAQSLETVKKLVRILEQQLQEQSNPVIAKE